MNKNSSLFSNLLDKNFYIDSREVRENSVFICLKGPCNDGHYYAKSVLAKFKKTLIICQSNSSLIQGIKKNPRVLTCKSTMKFLQNLAEIKRYLYEDKVFICITGSSGKTTLKNLLYDKLKKFGPSYKSIKSYNNHIGLPFTLINQKKKSNYNVYEAGMNAPGEIDKLTKILRPNIGIITNIGDAHIGKLGSQNNIFKAKSEIIHNIKSHGTLILNGDCKYYDKLKKIGKKKKLKILSFGKNSNNNISYKFQNNNNVIFKIKKNSYKIQLNEVSMNHVYNICAVLLVLYLLNLKFSQIIKEFKNLKNIRGRGNLKKIKRNIEIIDESYNSNPSSLKNSIINLDNIKTKKKKILVIGDMLELGKFSTAKHKELGKYINKFNFDKVFTIGKESKTLFNQLHKQIRGKSFGNVKEIVGELDNVLVDNSIILFKSSNSVGLNKLLNNEIY